MPGERDALEQFLGDITLGSVGRGELKRDRCAVAGADQVEAEAPEVARVRAAVAVAGELGVGDPGRSARALSVGQEVVHP